MTTRRALLGVIGAATMAAPFRAWAQGKVWRVGFLAPQRPVSLDSDFFGAFTAGMRELGYVEGTNLVMEWKFAEGKMEQLPSLAAVLVRLRVDVIVTAGTAATRAAQKATSTIPIVIGNSADPVGSGFVASLARPGGNITGLTNISVDIVPKQVERLLGMVPRLAHVGILVNPDNPAHPPILQDVQAAAQKAGVKVTSVGARGGVQELESAFSTLARNNARAVVLVSDGALNQHYREIAELAVKHRLPSISQRAEFAEAGGLMSYGQNIPAQYRRAATYVHRIVKGAKPADLPVEQSTTFESTINRKTARALGLAIPEAMLIGADKVIE